MRREREDSFSDGEDNSAAHLGGTDSFYNDASGNARINKTTDQPMMVNKSKEALQIINQLEHSKIHIPLMTISPLFVLCGRCLKCNHWTVMAL